MIIFSNEEKKLFNRLRVDSYEVLFVIENSYWKGTKLDFFGLNGKFFYTLVQQKLVSWKLFSSATLGRFDINFSRKNRGELLPRNERNLKGFKTLTEIKLTDTRIIVQLGKNGGQDKIVTICMRRDATDLLVIFKSKYN